MGTDQTKYEDYSDNEYHTSVIQLESREQYATPKLRALTTTSLSQTTQIVSQNDLNNNMEVFRIEDLDIMVVISDDSAQKQIIVITY